MNTTAAHTTDTPLGSCPGCGSTQLVTVTDGEYTNFLCERCARCWHIDLGRVSRVDPRSCPGCPRRGFCESRLPLDRDWGPPRAGTIAIVGGAGHIGTAVRRRLESLGTRAVILDRRDELVPTLADAATIVHLAGGLAPRHPDTFASLNVETMRRTLDAAGDGNGRRFVFLSFPGADPRSPNPYLRAKGEAEALLLASDFQPVIFRTSYVFGSPEDPGALVTRLLSHGTRAVTELGSGHQRWTPIYVGDVAEAIVRAALDPDAPTGTFELAGPQTMSVDDFVDRLNGRCVCKHHLTGVAGRVASYVVPGLSPTMESLLAADCVVADNAAHRFGVALHPVTEVWPEHHGDHHLTPWAPALFPA